jgi:hypothetical protein
VAVALVSTYGGCRTFSDTGEDNTELAGRQFGALASESGGSCLAVVDGREIWRRANSGAWSRVANTKVSVQSIVSVDGTIFAGGMDEAVMMRVSAGGEAERLAGFDNTGGRHEWFAGGPPLGVRGLTATADGAAILAAVHVGGIPRSVDKGETWTPTLPVLSDVHEVRAHPSRSNFVAAAAAVGLCTSDDGGQNWTVRSAGFEKATSLAVAVLQDEVLFSVQDGPFAKRSQVWRWRLGETRAEPVGDGLPEWLDGKVDTGQIAAGAGRVVICDGGGNLWLSRAGSNGWQRIAANLPYTFGVLLL